MWLVCARNAHLRRDACGGSLLIQESWRERFHQLLALRVFVLLMALSSWQARMQEVGLPDAVASLLVAKGYV